MDQIFAASVPIDQRCLERPVLVVLIDAEEDFDWGAAFSRANTSVRSIGDQWKAHRIFERYAITPTYLVDYPVAVSPDATAVLRDFLVGGHCEIGTQLHPWVTPPFDEELTPRNSYAGNLPPALERAKLCRLTRLIQDRFALAPLVYRAGRYGLGPSTLGLLGELGYSVDTSVWPLADLRRFGGPDYSERDATPFWTGAHGDLFELPVTRGFVGALRDRAPSFFPYLSSEIGERLKLAGFARRLGLAEQITLSPEGGTLEERIALTRTLLASGKKIFTYSYHSSSLVPGNTPFVRTQGDLDDFLAETDAFFAFFRDEVGGAFMTATALRAKLIAARPAGEAVPARAAGPHGEGPPQARVSS